MHSTMRLIGALLFLLSSYPKLLFGSTTTNTERLPEWTFQTIYTNDVSHIAACKSPFNPENGPFTEKALISSIDETVKGLVQGGIDIHILEPSFTWVPWWQSNVYPPAEHYRWFHAITGFARDDNGIPDYLENGGDMIAVFTKRCRELRISPFVSYRINDHHYKEYAHIIHQIISGKRSKMDGFSPGKGLPGVSNCISKFFAENPEYWVGPEPIEKLQQYEPLAFLHDGTFRTALRRARSMDWAHPEVRDHVFAFIEEICTNYDIDGLQIDFMRHPRMYQEQFPVAERQRISTEFVKRVRSLLDETSKNGHRWLAVRIPFRTSEWDQAGIDPRKFVDAGVDMVNLSCHYVTRQQSDLEKIVKVIPDTPVFLEFTYVCDQKRINIKPQQGQASEQFTICRLLTADQIYTLAHLAYSRGAQGVSAFNFVYYRSFAERHTGCGVEPPWEVFRHLKDKDWLAKQPQQYFLSGMDANQVSIQRTFSGGEKRDFAIDLAPPTQGWKNGGRLRIQTAEPYRGRLFKAWINKEELIETCNVSEFSRPICYDLLGDDDTLFAWIVPAHILKDGINTITLELAEGDPISLQYIDLGVR